MRRVVLEKSLDVVTAAKRNTSLRFKIRRKTAVPGRSVRYRCKACIGQGPVLFVEEEIIDQASDASVWIEHGPILLVVHILRGVFVRCIVVLANIMFHGLRLLIGQCWYFDLLWFIFHRVLV
jgi:hypothetical protein